MLEISNIFASLKLTGFLKTFWTTGLWLGWEILHDLIDSHNSITLVSLDSAGTRSIRIQRSGGKKLKSTCSWNWNKDNSFQVKVQIGWKYKLVLMLPEPSDPVSITRGFVKSDGFLGPTCQSLMPGAGNTDLPNLASKTRWRNCHHKDFLCCHGSNKFILGLPDVKTWPVQTLN